jgi:hypothetical protein
LPDTKGREQRWKHRLPVQYSSQLDSKMFRLTVLALLAPLLVAATPVPPPEDLDNPDFPGYVHDSRTESSLAISVFTKSARAPQCDRESAYYHTFYFATSDIGPCTDLPSAGNAYKYASIDRLPANFPTNIVIRTYEDLGCRRLAASYKLKDLSVGECTKIAVGKSFELAYDTAGPAPGEAPERNPPK